MKRTANPELDKLILQHLSDKYKLKEKREGIHLSSLVYCLTRGWYDLRARIEPTEREILLWALGYGLQEVLTPSNASTPILEYEGIIYRPDMLFELNGMLVELKTTRTSIKTATLALPDTWLSYIKGGCKIRDTKKYELAGLYMMGNYAPPFPLLYSETLEFDNEEIEEQWAHLLVRRDIYRGSISSNIPPKPFTYCYEWECRDCRYRLLCETIAGRSSNGYQG